MALAFLLDLLWPINAGAGQMIAWAPIAVGGAGLLLDWLSNRGNRPAPLPPGSGTWTKNLTPGFGGGGGGSSSTSTSNTSYNKNVTPFILPEYKGLMDTLRGQMETRLQGNGLPEGYEDYGLRQISDTYRGGEQAVTNQLIGRGLLGSPAEATAFAQQFALPRMGEMSNFRAQLPLQERQFKNEDWGMLMSLLDAFGKGQNEKGSSSTVTNSSSSGGGGGGGGGQIQPGLNLGVKGPGIGQNLTSFLGFLMGSGAFGRGGSSNQGQSMPYGPGINS
jgi:hypothetical protein